MRLCRNRCAVTTSVLKWVSRNTAPRTLHWNIGKTSRRWCLGFNWISRKISRKRRIREGGELTKGRNGQLPTVNVYSQFVMSVLAAWFIVVQILMTICILLEFINVIVVILIWVRTSKTDKSGHGERRASFRRVQTTMIIAISTSEFHGLLNQINQLQFLNQGSVPAQTT